MRLLSLLVLLWIVPSVWASDKELILEKVARANLSSQPGLQSYLVTIELDPFVKLYEHLSKTLPAQTPRPELPELHKAWLLSSGKSLVRADRSIHFPEAEALFARYRPFLAVELRDAFLPVRQAAQRTELMKLAEVKTSDNLIGDMRLRTVTISFAQPTNLGQAFYREGLELPQDRVQKLVFDVDVDQELVRRMEIQAVDRVLEVEIRYMDFKSGKLPEQILITSPDGHVDDRIVTRFSLVDGYWLPAKQTRITRRDEQVEGAFIKYVNYRINADLSEETKALLR